MVARARRGRPAFCERAEADKLTHLEQPQVSGAMKAVGKEGETGQLGRKGGKAEGKTLLNSFNSNVIHILVGIYQVISR